MNYGELIALCREKKLKIATAESCTGGYIASSITDVSGASDCFLGSVVAYSNDVKISVLKVKRTTLEEKGAVSRETAGEMSAGLEELLGADISLSVTGIAGPGGGTEEKPVGTVFIGVKARNNNPHVEGFLLKGLDRDSFKREVSRISLGLMLGHASQL